MERAKSKKKLRNKTIKPQKKTTRVTIDFPIEQHRRLKALAALEGVSLQEFIRSHVLDKATGTNLPAKAFKMLLKKTSEDHEDILRNLADR